VSVSVMEEPVNMELVSVCAVDALLEQLPSIPVSTLASAPLNTLLLQVLAALEEESLSLELVSQEWSILSILRGGWSIPQIPTVNVSRMAEAANALQEHAAATTVRPRGDRCSTPPPLPRPVLLVELVELWGRIVTISTVVMLLPWWAAVSM